MRSAADLRALGPIDARALTRDGMLLWLLVLPLALGLLARWALPWATELLRTELAFDLEPYRPLVAGTLFVLLAPMLVGLVTGFLLLDERDDHTLNALLVTPLSLRAYLAYRIGAPLLLCTAMSAAAMAIAGLVTIPWPLLVAVLLLAAIEGPILALLLASFAENKVQGFAVMKGLNVVLLAPLAAWFVDPPWQLLFAPFPTYWPLRIHWSAAHPGPGLALDLAVGLALHLALLAWLLARFRRVLHR